MDRVRNIAMLVARVLMCVLFLEGGWGKLVNAGAIQTAFDQRYHLPIPILAWLIAWIVELFGGLAILFGVYARAAGLVLAVWCITTALIGLTIFAERNQ